MDNLVKPLSGNDELHFCSYQNFMTKEVANRINTSYSVASPDQMQLLPTLHPSKPVLLIPARNAVSTQVKPMSVKFSFVNSLKCRPFIKK